MYRYRCPHCQRHGWVRFETVITGGHATREFYCGACERTWRETLADPDDVTGRDAGERNERPGR